MNFADVEINFLIHIWIRQMCIEYITAYNFSCMSWFIQVHHNLCYNNLYANAEFVMFQYSSLLYCSITLHFVHFLLSFLQCFYMDPAVLRNTLFKAHNVVVCYGRPLSVSGRPCYILPMFLFFFFYGRLILRPWLTEVRESFTRGGPWVALEKLLLGFFPGHP